MTPAMENTGLQSAATGVERRMVMMCLLSLFEVGFDLIVGFRIAAH
jgi:hypothetical protein